MGGRVRKIVLRGAARGRGFYRPRFSPGAYRFIRVLCRPYTGIVEKTPGLRVLGMEKLYAALGDFYRGDHRLLLVFRHVAKEDGPVFLRSVVRELPRWCRRQGVSLPGRAHTHFLYGKDVLNWAGAGARWLFPRIGGVPVVNNIIERQSIEAVHDILEGGDFPLALAPEGQVTYHMFRVSELASGTSSLALRVYDKLKTRKPDSDITVLPIAIGYDLVRNPERLYRRIFRELEEQLGTGFPAEGTVRERLLLAADQVISALEDYYAEGYPHYFKLDRDGDLQARIDSACEGILRCGEAILGYKPNGSILDRVFRLRYRGMYSRYPENTDVETLKGLKRKLTDFTAVFSHQYILHSQVVDVLEYLRVDDIPPGCSDARLMEFGLNLLDILNRLGGGDVNTRYTPRRKRAVLLVGDSIRTSMYVKMNGNGKKEAEKALTGDLYNAFRNLSERMEYELETGKP